MSKTATKIKKYYTKHIYTKKMVHDLVGKQYGITEEEYEWITGEAYEPDDEE